MFVRNSTPSMNGSCFVSKWMQVWSTAVVNKYYLPLLPPISTCITSRRGAPARKGIRAPQLMYEYAPPPPPPISGFYHE